MEFSTTTIGGWFGFGLANRTSRLSDTTPANIDRLRQNDSDDDHDFGIWADVDLDATQEEGAVVFTHYRVGFVDD